MRRTARAALAFASRVINLCIGGKWPETLCQRIGRRFGPYCFFCRVVGRFTRERIWHCRDEMTIADVIDWLRRKS